MQGQTNAFAKTAANTLRKAMTDAEKKLWHRLRANQLGVKFRRQHPFENYVPDFVCIEKQLVIEVDGSEHIDAIEHDDQRKKRLHAAGFHVLRFWNNEVLTETDGVLEGIMNALNPSPLQPNPPLEGEGAKAARPEFIGMAHRKTPGLVFTASANAGESNESD